MDFEKINAVLMKILEEKYNIKINARVIKKDDLNGNNKNI